MRDIDIAVNELKNNDLTLAVVKNGEVIYNSKERGVLPLYLAVTTPKFNTEGASVADKVTGRGAALLCAFGGIKTLSTGIMSKSAAAILEDNGIEFKCEKMVDFILNRTGDGGCPVEALTKDIENPEKALKPIKGFLQKIGVL